MKGIVAIALALSLTGCGQAASNTADPVANLRQKSLAWKIAFIDRGRAPTPAELIPYNAVLDDLGAYCTNSRRALGDYATALAHGDHNRYSALRVLRLVRTMGEHIVAKTGARQPGNCRNMFVTAGATLDHLTQ